MSRPSRAATPATAIVFAGGEPVEHALGARLPADALVVAADSGLYQAWRVGRRVDVAVGDFDSVEPEDLASIEGGVEVEQHPTAKDKTDIELGLDAAVARGACRVEVVMGAGGRLDHALANLLVLALPAYADVSVRGWVGGARVSVVRGRCTLWGAVGDTVSLLPVGGSATGITTTGLRYALRDGTLHFGSTRGISNVFDAPTASVSVAGGVLLAVQPGPQRPGRPTDEEPPS